MTPEEQNERNQECRHEVLAFLSQRSVLAFRPEMIRSKLNRGYEHDFTVAEIKSALENLRTRGLISAEPDPHGSAPYYKVTGEGQLFYERNP